MMGEYIPLLKLFISSLLRLLKVVDSPIYIYNYDDYTKTIRPIQRYSKLPRKETRMSKKNDNNQERGDSQAYLERKKFFDGLLTVYGRKPVLEALQDKAIERTGAQTVIQGLREAVHRRDEDEANTLEGITANDGRSDTERVEVDGEDGVQT